MIEKSAKGFFKVGPVKKTAGLVIRLKFINLQLTKR